MRAPTTVDIVDQLHAGRQCRADPDGSATAHGTAENVRRQRPLHHLNGGAGTTVMARRGRLLHRGEAATRCGDQPATGASKTGRSRSTRARSRPGRLDSAHRRHQPREGNPPQRPSHPVNSANKRMGTVDPHSANMNAGAGLGMELEESDGPSPFAARCRFRFGNVDPASRGAFPWCSSTLRRGPRLRRMRAERLRRTKGKRSGSWGRFFFEPSPCRGRGHAYSSRRR